MTLQPLANGLHRFSSQMFTRVSQGTSTVVTTSQYHISSYFTYGPSHLPAVCIRLCSQLVVGRVQPTTSVRVLAECNHPTPTSLLIIHAIVPTDSVIVNIPSSSVEHLVNANDPSSATLVRTLMYYESFRVEVHNSV